MGVAHLISGCGFRSKISRGASAPGECLLPHKFLVTPLHTHTHTLQAKAAAEKLYGADHSITLEAAAVLTDSQRKIAYRQELNLP